MTLPMGDAPTARVVPAPGRPRRICFFNSTPFWGGGEKWHLDMACGFRERGHDVTLMAHPHSPLFERARAADLDTVGFRISRRSALNPVRMWRLTNEFRSRGIETVVFNGPSEVKSGGLAARAAGVRERLYCRCLAVPVRDRWLNRYLFTRVLTHVTTNSEATKSKLLQNLGRVLPPASVRVIRHGIDLDEIDSRPLERLFERRDDELILGNVGRLTAQKGQAFLIDVARALKDAGLRFRLLIAGEGELKDQLRDKVRTLGVEDVVELLGFVDDVPSFLNSIDVFLLGSLWEGFGYVIAEAGAARKPVVALDISSNPEIIEHGKTGYLVQPGDVAAFAARVRELAENADLRTAMGEAGRTRMEEQFRIEREISEMEEHLWG